MKASPGLRTGGGNSLLALGAERSDDIAVLKHPANFFMAGTVERTFDLVSIANTATEEATRDQRHIRPEDVSSTLRFFVVDTSERNIHI